jgi:hypothetical protein
MGTSVGDVPDVVGPGGRRAAPEPIQDRFERWIGRHPEIWGYFQRFACELRDAGATRIGAKLIAERIRYEMLVSRPDPEEPFKINNNFTSRLARRLIEQDPSYAGLFETRRLLRD